MSIQRWLLSLFTIFLLGVLVVNGQRPMTGVISATNPDGGAFGNAIYYTAYDSTRQLIHGVGLNGILYTFNSNSLVLQNTTYLRQLTFSTFSFSNLNIPVGIHLKTGSNSRLIITYSLTSNVANMVHTIMLNADTLVPVAVITTDWATATSPKAPTIYDRTTFDQGKNVYLRASFDSTDQKIYAFDVSGDSFVSFISTTTYSDPYIYTFTVTGTRPSETLPPRYFNGKSLLFYDNTVASSVFYRSFQFYVGDFLSFINSGSQFFDIAGLGRLVNPSPYSSNLTVHLGSNSADQLSIRSTTLGSSSSYLLYLSRASPSRGNFIVQVPSSAYSDTNNNNLAVKSLTVFPSQTTWTQIGVDEDAYPGNNTRVFFLTTSTGRVMKYRFRDNGGQLDIESTPVTTENIVAGGIPFTDQTLITSEKRIIVSSNADVPNDQSKLYIVPFADCGSKTTCSSCIEMNDPYCGWCVLDGKCSYNSTCSSSNLQNGWLKTPGTNQCPSISNVINPNPQQIGTGSISTSLSLITVPPSITYTCKYTRGNGQVLTQSMTGSISSGICTLPSLSTPLFHGVYESISLSVIYDQNGRNVVIGNAPSPITVYNCGYSTTCSQCVSNTFGCKWASEQNLCVDSSVNLSSQMSASTSGSCPSVTSDQIALLPQNTTSTLTIQGINLPPAGSLQYSCVFSTGDTTVGTRINSAGLTCSSPTVLSDSAIVRVNVEVKYGAYTLPHSSQMVISFYDCTYFGNVCF